MTGDMGQVVLAEVREALAAELRRRRAEQGLTQSELAGRLGSSQSRVAKMEGAGAGVTLDLLVKGLAVLGASRLDVAKAAIRPLSGRAGG